MNATEELRAEHEGILIMLKIMETICDRLESGEPVDMAHLEGIIEFLRVFAEQCHHGKEEDILFPAMEKAGVPREGGPIGVMLTEHGVGRNCIRRMGDALQAMKAGDKDAQRRFVDAAREYIGLLRDHINKENGVLFPVAEHTLSPDELSLISQQFENLETEKIGQGRHESFHRMMDELAGIYLR